MRQVPGFIKLLRNFIQMCLLFVLVILIFPILTCQLVFEAWQNHKKKKGKIPNTRSSELSIADLSEKLSLDEIEASEYVYDPLNAVPHLPFGHNYSTWLKFKSQLDEDDELWSFSRVFINANNQMVKQSGYAIVHGDKIRFCYYKENHLLPGQFDHQPNEQAHRWWQFNKYDVS